MSPNEFLIVNEERQKLREINGEQPEYVNFNNAATKFLLDQVDTNFKVQFQMNGRRKIFTYVCHLSLNCRSEGANFLSRAQNQNSILNQYITNLPRNSSSSNLS